MNDLTHKLVDLRQEVKQLASAANQGKEVTIIAVSKTHPTALIEQAYMAGQRHFGENYIQEAVVKKQELKDLAITWHFIGHLQSNKAKIAAEHFDWVQSIHSLKLASKLNEHRNSSSSAPLNITVQINISNEENKSGISPAVAPDFCHGLKELPNLEVRGLMTISENTDSVAKQREYFKQMQQLFIQLGQSQKFPQWDTLSMGMSADMESAILEGSNMIRIGSAIFGPRK